MNKKPPRMRAAVLECIRRLTEDPYRPGLHTHRVRGTVGVYEAYIDSSNRLTFEWDGDTIVLRNNCNHDILKNP